MTDAALLAVAVAIGLTLGAGGARFMLARARRGALPLDLPDPRRLHLAPTPRGGGVGVALAGLVALPLALTTATPPARALLGVLVLAWALPNAVLGLIDDHHALSPRTKLAVQLVAATTAVALGLQVASVEVPPLGVVRLGALAAPFATLWLVWIANVFNFMDGMDALAAECGALFFAALALIALLAGAAAPATVAAAVGAALLGFRRYNRSPARIFMGDGGSLFAGALLGGLPLVLARDEVAAVPLAVSALVLGSFGFDATFTVLRRALRGQALRPHRAHFYQRLALAGWPHHRVRRLYLGLTAAGIAGALVLHHGGAAAQLAALVAVTASLASLVAVTRGAERHARR